MSIFKEAGTGLFSLFDKVDSLNVNQNKSVVRAEIVTQPTKYKGPAHEFRGPDDHVEGEEYPGRTGWRCKVRILDPNMPHEKLIDTWGDNATPQDSAAKNILLESFLTEMIIPAHELEDCASALQKKDIVFARLRPGDNNMTYSYQYCDFDSIDIRWGNEPRCNTTCHDSMVAKFDTGLQDEGLTYPTMTISAPCMVNCFVDRCGAVRPAVAAGERTEPLPGIHLNGGGPGTYLFGTPRCTVIDYILEPEHNLLQTPEAGTYIASPLIGGIAQLETLAQAEIDFWANGTGPQLVEKWNDGPSTCPTCGGWILGSDGHAVAERLQRYWRTVYSNDTWNIFDRLCLGACDPPAEPLVGTRDYRNQVAWSTAFINYLIKSADEDWSMKASNKTPPNGKEAAHLGANRNSYGADAHWGYVIAVAQGASPHWAAWDIRAGKYKAQVGDILVKGRASTVSPRAYDSHGDVVYKIEDNEAKLVGGNVSQTAKEVDQIQLDSDGFYSADHLDTYTIILKKHGMAFYEDPQLSYLSPSPYEPILVPQRLQDIVSSAEEDTGDTGLWEAVTTIFSWDD